VVRVQEVIARAPNDDNELLAEIAEKWLEEQQ
jgi:hypothetical protein